MSSANDKALTIRHDQTVMPVVGEAWQRMGDLTHERVEITALDTRGNLPPAVTFLTDDGNTITRSVDNFLKFYRPIRRNS